MLAPSIAVMLAASAGQLSVVCREDNDLFKILVRSGRHLARFENPKEAVEKAKAGSGLLILSGANIDWAEARKKHLRVYIETPRSTLESKKIEWERAYVASDALGSELPRGRILSIGRQAISIERADAPILSIGRVAGFDRLAFGTPKQSWPLLWSPDPDTLRSYAPLSSFSSGRYAPSKAWESVWRYILGWLGDPESSRLAWEPAVRPSFARNAALPRGIEAQAQRRAADWFLRSHLILSPGAVETYTKADQWPDRVGPGPLSQGDGSRGILEGFSSQIDPAGNQPVRWYRRADCNAESAMALALAGDARAKRVGERIGDFIALESGVLHRDPTKASYGLVGWNDQPANKGTFYGDDNARFVLGLIGGSGALHINRWDATIARCILGNFRTSGVNGFRGDALGESDIDRLGWQHFFGAQTVNMAPHFEAYMWACYLWLYSKTGYKPLLKRSEAAIERTMASGENAWTWTNGLQQERARMLLPLAWLVRVDDSAKHRAWLKDMLQKVVGYQDACGAIREEFGDLSHGIAGPPRSNEAYGTAETPLIQENGDPLADLLYTTNFAFLGLHEAAMATHDPEAIRAEERLAKFLCRIQIRSSTHPELDGAWFRAFDFGDWDYWASNADLGWGAWSIETGWSVSWIAGVLGLRERRLALWDMGKGFKTDPVWLREMLPGQ